MWKDEAWRGEVARQYEAAPIGPSLNLDIEKENVEAVDRYRRELQAWEGRKEESKESEEERRLIHENSGSPM